MSLFIGELIVSSTLVWIVKATLLLSLAWGLHVLLRNVNPRWQVCLWRTTLIALVGLPVLGLVIPHWQIVVRTKQHVAVDDPILSAAADTKTMTLPLSTVTEDYGTRPPAAASTERREPPEVFQLPMAKSTVQETAAANVGTINGTINGKLVAVSIWFVVAGILLLRPLLSILRIRTLIRNSVPAESDLIELSAQAMKDVGLKRLPEIRTSKSVAVPFAAGLLHPIVVLPAVDDYAEDDSELKLILTHELGHVAGRDIPWAMFACIVRSLWWFHPLVWRLPSAHQVACETVCDALATQNHSARATYRSLLARLALLVNAQNVFDGNVAMSATAEITRRLRRLSHHIPSDSLSRHRLHLAMSASLIVVTTIAAATLVPRADADETPATKQPSENTVTAQGKPEDTAWKIRLNAIDEDTGAAIANPEFTVQLGEDSTLHQGNNKGSFSATIPTQTPRYCYVKVKADGYTPMRGFWANHKNRTDKLPEDVTFRMTRGVTVGGTVVNEENQPVSGATVWFSAGTQVPGERIEQSFYQEEYTTDKQGQWRCPIAPREMNTATFKVNHPDYARITSSFGIDRQILSLRAKTHLWILKKGFDISGVVTGPDGSPVEGAHLAVGTLNSYQDDGPFAVTDANGRYEFRRVGSSGRNDSSQRPYQMSVTILQKDLAPQLAVVPGTGDVPLAPSTWKERTMDFQLNEGRPLTVRITNNKDKPVAKVWIFPSAWRDGTDGLTILREHGIPEYTNENGIWRWDHAPIGEKIQYDILARGYMDVRSKTLVAGDDANVRIGLSRPQILVGHVIDADTKEPIDEFVIQKGFEGMSEQEYPDGVWWTNNTQGRAGRYRRIVSMPKPSYRWKFVAKGYEPFASDTIPVGEGEFTLNVELKKIARSSDKPTQKDKAVILKQISALGGVTSHKLNTYDQQLTGFPVVRIPCRADFVC